MRVIGLSEAAARETRARVQAALRSLDLPPKGILINLTPSNCPKEPGLLDLAIALDGDLLPVRGSPAIADMALAMGVRELLLPLEDVPAAACLPGVPSLIGIRKLHQTIEHLTGLAAIRPANPSTSSQASEAPHVDLSEVRGQESSKRALEMAAAGGHPEKLGLSFSQAQRYLKVARTIADLSGSDSIRTSHLAEALQTGVPLAPEPVEGSSRGVPDWWAS